MTHNDLAVHIRNAGKQFGKNEILKNFNMRVPRGSIYGLLGASGCGKTTLLNCIVNITSLNSGTIQVLDAAPRILGAKVGYMPQEMALVDEFTVEDTIYYFGRLSNMSDRRIDSKLSELMKLLQLPPRDRYIRNCSGGEKRRVSFAASMVHSPELLILDEPTVGLDSILREKIWDYLVEMTRDRKVTVIITTHYVQETCRADVVGMMRQGRLLAEESPRNLLNRFETDMLEEVFFELCQRQNFESLAGSSSNNFADVPNAVEQTKTTVGGYSLNSKRMKALLSKNAKQLYRNYVGIMFMVVLPLISNVGMLVTFGTELQDLKLGIVNDETMSILCPHNSVECHFTNLSCRFLDHLEDPGFVKVKHGSLPEAFASAKKGELRGVLHISKNFTEAIHQRKEQGRNATNEVLNSSEVKVWLDMSDTPIGLQMQVKLHQLYKDFAFGLAKDCEINPKLFNFFNTKLLYDTEKNAFTEYIVPGLTFSVVAFMLAMVTSQIIIKERTEGFWDRSIVAGVSALELILAHFITQILIIMIYTIQFVVVTFMIFQIEMAGSLWIVGLMIYLQGILGFGIGFWISIICRDTTSSTSLVQGYFYLHTLLCGMVWPVEGMPLVLQYISKLTPFTLPIISFRHVMKKGWSLSNFEVLSGVGVEVIWIIIFAVVNTVLLKSKR